MTRPGQPPDQPEFHESQIRWGRAERRQERIRQEIQRNRAGGHRIPTWVLTVLLVAVLAFVAFWAWGP